MMVGEEEKKYFHGIPRNLGSERQVRSHARPSLLTPHQQQQQQQRSESELLLLPYF